MSYAINQDIPLVSSLPVDIAPLYKEEMEQDNSPHFTHDTIDVTIDKNSFLKVLAHQQALIEKRSAVSVLSHVLLWAHDGIIALTGTDMEKSLVMEVPAIVRQEGAITVPVHIFYDIIRKMPDTQGIVLRTIPMDRLVVESGSVKFELVTLPASEFPKIHPQTGPFEITLPANDLKRLIEDTAFCMSTDDMRLSLGGIYFHAHGDQLRAVATDSHRLALSWLLCQTVQLIDFPSIIVGGKTLQAVKKLLEEYEDQHVLLSLSQHQMLLSFSGCSFSSRLLEGQFPSYMGAIPQPQAHFRKITLDVKTFSSAVSRVGMVNFEKHNVIKLDFQQSQLQFSASSTQYGSAVENIIVHYEGEPITLGFPPRYLLDMCQHIKGDKLEMYIQDNVSPALFYDIQDPHVSFVLMPIRG